MSVHVEAGREAASAWRVLRRYPRSQRSWLAIRPETGRTHQIRVHLASIGLPIAGDPVYGRARDATLTRPALHAATLGFRHPRSGRSLRCEAPLPADLAGLLERLEHLERREEPGR